MNADVIPQKNYGKAISINESANLVCVRVLAVFGNWHSCVSWPDICDVRFGNYRKLPKWFFLTVFFGDHNDDIPLAVYHSSQQTFTTAKISGICSRFGNSDSVYLLEVHGSAYS